MDDIYTEKQHIQLIFIYSALEIHYINENIYDKYNYNYDTSDIHKYADLKY